MPRIAIAGAGLVGRLLAWRLSRLGWHVSLFDDTERGETRSASHVAAAMLSPLAEQASADAVVFELAQRSMALWPQWLSELEASGHAPVYFRREGTVVVAHPADSGTLLHFQQMLHHKLAPPDLERVRPIEAAQIAALEPALAGRFSSGLFLEGEGQIGNDELLAQLQVELEARSVVWHRACKVHALAAGQLHSDAGVCHADAVLDARGVGARTDWPGLRGVRGEVLTVECAGVVLHRPVRLMHPRYQLYIAPRPQHRFVVGATELESQDEGPATLRSVLELGSALHSLHPGFGEARVLNMAAALRPALDDHRPTLRRQQGVWQINGLYRHGYLCAPALVHELVQALTR